MSNYVNGNYELMHAALQRLIELSKIYVVLIAIKPWRFTAMRHAEFVCDIGFNGLK